MSMDIYIDLEQLLKVRGISFTAELGGTVSQAINHYRQVEPDYGMIVDIMTPELLVSVPGWDSWHHGDVHMQDDKPVLHFSGGRFVQYMGKFCNVNGIKYQLV